MTARNANRAEAAVRLGSSGAWTDLGAATGRDQLATAFARAVVRRTQPGGWVVDLPLDQRSGEATMMVPRTAAVDKLLADAHNRPGELRIRRRGSGSGLPERIVPAVLGVQLSIVTAQLCLWTLTVTQTGPPADSTQS